MLKKIAGLLLCCNAVLGGAYAQNQCGTDEMYHQLKKDHPEIGAIEEKLESEIQQKLHLLDLHKLAKTTGGTDTTTYDIPIVIHVIHDYGSEYLSDDDIFNAVSHWTEVFTAQNADTADVITPFKPYVGNAHMRFHLATKDPDGNPTKGITRHQSYLTMNAGDQAKLDGWPNDQYINIWFINTFSGAHSGAAAYAYYPSSGASLPYYDGVIGIFSYLDYDKAIPHEIGHVLNLQHTWGNTNQPGVACGDDLVEDTPPTMGHLTTGCTPASLYDVTCAGNYFVAAPGGGIIDYPDTTNAQNVMDYTYCQKMFTIGQVDRMQAALTSNVAGRNNLYSAANLAATGALAPRPDLAPVADFSVDRPGGASERAFFLCANSTTRFLFKNKSWNDTITDISWTFSNDPLVTTSNASQLLNQFSTPGWVTVSITATGNNTGSATYTNTHAVYVADNATKNPNGFRQDFASVAAMDQWPIFNYYNNQFKWEWYNGVGYNDNTCVRYRSFDDRTSPANKVGTPEGDYDDMFTPGFDLSAFSGSTLNLNFNTSGAFRTGSTPQDTLQIMGSTDCGKTWQTVTNLTGTNLINKGKQSIEYTPSAHSDWKAQTIAIPNTFLTSKVFFKFRFKPADNGNNLYLDAFAITPYTTEVNEVAADPSKIDIYPNPSHGDVRMAVNTTLDGKMSYVIKDVTGKIIYTKAEQYASKGVNEEIISRSVFGAPGLYLISVTIANTTITRKLVIE